MKRSIQIAFILMVASIGSIASAQDKPSIAEPFVRQGSWAGMFTISGLDAFDLRGMGIGETRRWLRTSPFNAPVAEAYFLYGLGLKYFIMQNLALRMSVAFNREAVDGESDDWSRDNWGLGLGVEHHCGPTYGVSPYIGLGINVAGGGMSWSGKMNIEEGESKDGKISGSSSSFGASAFGGADWYFTQGIALGAELGMGFASHSSSFTDTDGKSHDMPSSSGIRMFVQPGVHFTVNY